MLGHQRKRIGKRKLSENLLKNNGEPLFFPCVFVFGAVGSCSLFVLSSTSILVHLYLFPAFILFLRVITMVFCVSVSCFVYVFFGPLAPHCVLWATYVLCVMYGLGAGFEIVNWGKEKS